MAEEISSSSHCSYLRGEQKRARKALFFLSKEIIVLRGVINRRERRTICYCGWPCMMVLLIEIGPNAFLPQQTSFVPFPKLLIPERPLKKPLPKKQPEFLCALNTKTINKSSRINTKKGKRFSGSALEICK